jgi:hypothetical protein
MDHHSGIITQPKFRMWLRPDGIVHMTWASQVTIDLEDAAAAISTMAELTGGRRSPLLVDLHDSGQPSRPARLEFTRQPDLVSAVALLVGTPLSRIMGNFYLRVNAPPYPVRLVEDEASALAWLRPFVAPR